MDKLRTATGKIIETDFVAENGMVSQLYIKVYNMEYMEIARIFSDPNETIQLWYNDEYFSEFTKLVAIMPEADGYKVILERA